MRSIRYIVAVLLLVILGAVVAQGTSTEMLGSGGALSYCGTWGGYCAPIPVTSSDGHPDGLLSIEFSGASFSGGKLSRSDVNGQILWESVDFTGSHGGNNLYGTFTGQKPGVGTVATGSISATVGSECKPNRRPGRSPGCVIVHWIAGGTLMEQ